MAANLEHPTKPSGSIIGWNESQNSLKEITCDDIFIIKAATQELEKAMAPYSSTLAWKIPWTEEPGRLQSMGLLGVGHD